MHQDAEIDKIKRKLLKNRIKGKAYTATTLLEKADKLPFKTVSKHYLQYIENLKSENRVRYVGMYQVSY